MPLLGNVVISKKFLRTRKIMVMHSNERGECDVGWNPNHPIFHERSGSRDEHEEHEEGNEGKITRGTQENTQTNKNDHTCARSTSS